MYTLESVKSSLEKISGIARPTTKEVSKLLKPRKARPTRFKDDGLIPNNPTLPFIHYRRALDLSADFDPAAIYEVLFKRNGWTGSWRNGIYDFVHYHPRTHEVLGIAEGKARVRFGGNNGKIVDLAPGDVVVLPAGTGHQAIRASEDLLVVGAYPTSGKYDEYEASAAEHSKAIRMIAKVRLPQKDPVYGKQGPLKKLWKSKRHKAAPSNKR